jgi:hypothetical protein
MSDRPQRPHGRTFLAAAGAGTVAALLTACGGGISGDAVGAARSAGTAAPVTAVAAPSPSPDDAPLIEEGKSLTVKIPGNDAFDEPATEAKVTLSGLEQADRLPQGGYLDPEVAEQGTTFVCLEFKVENAGSAEFDTAPLTQARWTGDDGETKKVDQELGGDCEGLGLAKESLLSEADPRPGEFVRGTTLLKVPDTQPGTLEFADALEHPLFKVEITPSR